jgi:polyribonucleotide nucleotidyltransferase
VGGAVLRALLDATGTQIDISDEGVVTIASVDAAAGQEAKRRIEELTASVEVGKTVGTVLKLLDFGAIVQVMPGKDGCCTSRRSPARERGCRLPERRPGSARQVIETDERGRLKLSMKAADPIKGTVAQ